jgi:hypothetical protein
MKLYMAKYINKLLNKFRINNFNFIVMFIKTKIKLEPNPK